MKRLFAVTVFVSYISISFAQIGIGTTSPNSTLDIRGSLSGNLQTFTGTYTATGTDYNLIFTGTSATTLTLPTAVGITGRMYSIKNASSNTSALTVATTSSQTIDGATTQALSNSYQTLSVISDGSNWHIIGYGLPSGGSGTNWALGGNSVAGMTNIGTISNYSLPFITNNTERMRLTSTGLGIGITSPAEKLEVGGNIRISGGTRSLIFGTPGGDPDAVIEHRAYNGTDKNELLFYVGDDVNTSYGPDRIRMIAEEMRFQSFNSQPNSSLANAESSTNLNTNMYINGAGKVGIGTTTINSSNPEQLIVDAGSGSGFQNVIVGKGNTNSYAQLNIQNINSGSGVSSDVVATANNGTESVNYIDMGINGGGNNSSGVLGGANTAYLYATGNDFAIGNGTSAKNLNFFTNNSGTYTEQMRITSTGSVGIGTSSPNSTLSVNGSIAVKYTTESNNYTLTASDYVVISSANTGKTWTLPAAGSCAGRVYKLVNHGGASITLSASVYIAESTTTTTLSNAAGSNTMEIMSDGTNWRKIN